MITLSLYWSISILIRTEEPYNSAEVRVAVAIQMILSSDQLIPIKLSAQIAKDLEDLRVNSEYTSRWVKPNLKRARLMKELELLKKHTEIDDSISLNQKDAKIGETTPNQEDFDQQAVFQH